MKTRKLIFALYDREFSDRYDRCRSEDYKATTDDISIAIDRLNVFGRYPQRVGVNHGQMGKILEGMELEDRCYVLNVEDDVEIKDKMVLKEDQDNQLFKIYRIESKYNISKAYTNFLTKNGRSG